MHDLALRIVICAGMFSSTPLVAGAQTYPEYVSGQVGHYNRMTPIAGFQTVNALSGDWQTIDIYFVPNRTIDLPNGRPWIEHVARRMAGAKGLTGTESWTTSRDCPALYNTLVWMTVLIAPRIEIAGVTPSEAAPAGRRPTMLMADGVATTVWGRGTQPDHTLNASVEMTSNGGLIAEFGKAATDNLASCWSDQRPSL